MRVLFNPFEGSEGKYVEANDDHSIGHINQPELPGYGACRRVPEGAVPHTPSMVVPTAARSSWSLDNIALIVFFGRYVSAPINSIGCTRAPLRGRRQPPATLAQIIQQNMKGA